MADDLDGDRPNQQTPALDLIDRLLARLACGECRKAMVFMPPQAGKSERCSRRFPLWLLVRDPTARIAIVSYSLELAVRWGRQIKRDIEANPSLGITLRQDSQAAGRWQTEQGGGIYCVGVGGGGTGVPMDFLIIDDPVKDRAEAESATMRDRAWDWWESVAKVRADRTLLIQTRWHTDDLAGRMLEREPSEWDVLSIPAIAETEDDPLGRKPGEEILTPRWPVGHYANLQKTTSPYVWASLYQQHPTAAEGGLFKRGDWRYWESYADEHGSPMLRLEADRYALADCQRFATLDLATSTKRSADFTVACVWAITPGGDLVLLDRARDRVPEIDHAAFLAPLRQRWLTPYDVTHIESRMFGTTLVYALGRDGVPVAELDADVDKLTRALPAAGLVRQHRVWLPSTAAWLDEWLDEHADFPNVAHDDQVDNTGYAARVAIAHWLPPEDAVTSEARRMADLTRDPDDVDLMSAPM
jgi:predicted phage terminase large subunit-like protein